MSSCSIRTWKSRLKRTKPVMAIQRLRGAIRATLADLDQQWLLQQVVTLDAVGPPRGRALFSYRIEGFVVGPDDPVVRTHTNYWQSLEMARALTELGYTVDVIDYRNSVFLPEHEYSVFVDVRHNMERLAGRVGKDCLKIFHIDTAHLLANNAGEANRLMGLLGRRGISLPARRYEPPNRGIEFADCATGNVGAFSLDTFRYAGKEVHPLPAPVAHAFDFPKDKDWDACRKRFMWLGSGGLVHKGLDLVLEAFAEMPDCHLTVCAPIDQEPDFKKAYHKELFETPNIETAGFIEIGGPEFRRITSQCAALVYPSSSEGLSTSTVECMHAGLLPVITYETSVPVNDFGFEIDPVTPERIREIVRSVSELSPDELRRRCGLAWRFARENHSRERFSEVYRKVLGDCMARHLNGDAIAQAGLSSRCQPSTQAIHVPSSSG
jgi:glycosyltransferase involved in cell wall biosynthesis